MSIEHIVRCDALLPGGQGRCESRATVKSPHELPKGWNTLVHYDRPAAGNVLGGAFAPVMQVAKSSLLDDLVSEEDKAKREENVGKLVEAMESAAMETMPNVPHSAHVCDKHPLPAVNAKPHMMGCVGY